ncbi:MAG: TonB family protein [Bacteroidota bacterium]
MNQKTTLRADLNEILFDQRHKAYGAYYIRKEYPRTIMSAFYLVTSTGVALLLLFYFLRQGPRADLADLQAGMVNLVEVTVSRPLPKPPQPKIAKLPPPAVKQSAPPAKPKGMDTQESKRVNPTPDADEPATIAPDSAYRDKQPGPTTTDTSSSDVLGGDPTGTGDQDTSPPCLGCPAGDGDGGDTKIDDPDPFAPFLGEMPMPQNLKDIRKEIGYPREATQARLEGKVIYRVLVDEEGRYLRHLVLRSSHPLFERACAKHLSKLSFTPGKMGDRAVKCWVVLPFKFRLMR